MNSLVELITVTKGIEYLIAIAFLFAFVAFWQWQQHRGKGLAVRVIPLLVLSLAFAGLASTCIGQTAMATPAKVAQEWPDVDEAHYVANAVGPAKFAAHEMGPDVVSCQTCHHHSDTPGPCTECHNAPFDTSTPDKPGAKAAYHQRCKDCHTEAFNGPMTCTECHSDKPDEAEETKSSPSPVTAPTISHPLLASYSNCFACHVPEGPLPLPGNHSEYRANVECLGCHKPSSGDGKDLAKVVKEETSQQPADAQPEVVPASEQSAAVPAAEQPAAPPAAEQPAETQPVPVAQQPEAQPEPAPTAQPKQEATPTAPPKQASGPARITHSLAGRDNCVMCHPAGSGGVKPAPADHAGRANQSCQTCHQPS